MSLYPGTRILPSGNIYPGGLLDQNTIQIASNIAPVLDLTVAKEWTINVNTSVALSIIHILNTYPVMGYVYQPTDVDGSVVRVESDLSDYYYILDTTVNQLYWGPEYRSQNTTNDW